ncbi:MAG: alpha/beta hydrolase [Candidatus Thiodiazotropha endolucinida]
MTDNSLLFELFPGFEHRNVDIGNGIEIAVSIGGSGPPLLLLHGHPQTRALWHRVAPKLSESYTIVAADLRGYGDSSKPSGETGHENYSKRVMAHDQLSVMQNLGFEKFSVLAHDRGARVAHRLAADHPNAVEQMVLLDIAPTLAMYRKTTEIFARSYWHWFFLIQPSPTPERLIESDPVAYIHDVMGRRSAGLAPFDKRALSEYERCITLDGTAHGICEDYRAAAGIDMQHDQADLDTGYKLEMPLLVLWGEQGVVHSCFNPMDEWQQLANMVEGEPLPCGHYIAEEAPEVLLEHVLPFLSKTFS